MAALHQASKKALHIESNRKQQPLWMTDKTEGKTKEKNSTYNNWLGNNTQENWKKYKKT